MSYTNGVLACEEDGQVSHKLAPTPPAVIWVSIKTNAAL